VRVGVLFLLSLVCFIVELEERGGWRHKAWIYTNIIYGNGKEGVLFITKDSASYRNASNLFFWIFLFLSISCLCMTIRS
jgi:hypothetical protein